MKLNLDEYGQITIMSYLVAAFRQDVITLQQYHLWNEYLQNKKGITPEQAKEITEYLGPLFNAESVWEARITNLFGMFALCAA